LNTGGFSFCECGPTKVEDLYHWLALFTGPSDTPYKGATFAIEINFAPNYPMKPPTVKFTTKIYHPCVTAEGDFSFPILTDWTPSSTFISVLEGIHYLFKNPKAGNVTEKEIASIFDKDRAQFNRNVIAEAEKHAYF